jgi:hypothetical protein
MELARQLNSVEGFITRYFYNLANSASQLDAYEMTESEHERLFSRRRYTCYDSFRQVKNRKLRG